MRTASRTRGPDGERGFSLIELVSALAIALILFALAVPQFGEQWARSKRSEALIALAAVHDAEKAYRHENNGTTTVDMTDLFDEDMRDFSATPGGMVGSHYYVTILATPRGYYAFAVGNLDSDSSFDIFALSLDDRAGLYAIYDDISEIGRPLPGGGTYQELVDRVYAQGGN